MQALERVPSDIRRDGGVARMSDPQMIKEIMGKVSIPVRYDRSSGLCSDSDILSRTGNG